MSDFCTKINKSTPCIRSEDILILLMVFIIKHVAAYYCKIRTNHQGDEVLDNNNLL